ncbi:PapD-like protein [Sordaria brevicollis]|uniref:PapD-like protein n=1 Tax=Sordaria brevicollis TaxID=83679 RepID=A0AAE0NVB3_SORBR|nr:PapD-like protein [Sordaria brevicollis]
MSVEIDPLELGFRRPFTVEVSQILRIRNPNTSPVAFKVKTTAPKQYCVRPNSGRIEPGHDVEVSVLLQAMKQEPPSDARCRDKFLVQSVTITGDKEFTNVAQIWDGVDKSQIQEKKIRVLWLPAFGEETTSPVAATPIRPSTSNRVEETPAPFTSPSETRSSTTDTREIKQEPDLADNFQSTVAAAATTVQSTAAETYEQLKDQLAKAQATIASLQNDAASGLRQRKATVADAVGEQASNVQATAQDLAQSARQGTEGVPVQIAAVLCLVSFLLAYIFF